MITLLLLVCATYTYCCSSPTCHSWWITHSMQCHRRGCNDTKWLHSIFFNPFCPAFYRALQSYNSSGDWAREPSKPSTDSASLLLEIEKKSFSFSVRGFLEVTSQWEHVLEILANPEPQPINPFCWLKVLLKTRSKSASIEPLIDLLAYM